VGALVAALAAVRGWRDVAPVAGVPPTSGGAEVAAVVQDADAVADGVAALVAAGARVHGVERDRPSLQDVYFALHERSGRGVAA
jgi:hypothetical protein